MPDSRSLAPRAQPGRLISESPFCHPQTRPRRLPTARAVGAERSRHVQRVVRRPGHRQSQLLLSFSRRPLGPNGPAAHARCAGWSTARAEGARGLGRAPRPAPVARCLRPGARSKRDGRASAWASAQPVCCLLVGSSGDGFHWSVTLLPRVTGRAQRCCACPSASQPGEALALCHGAPGEPFGAEPAAWKRDPKSPAREDLISAISLKHTCDFF